jgi:hypothetical protein
MAVESVNNNSAPQRKQRWLNMVFKFADLFNYPDRRYG